MPSVWEVLTRGRQRSWGQQKSVPTVEQTKPHASCPWAAKAGGQHQAERENALSTHGCCTGPALPSRTYTERSGSRRLCPREHESLRLEGKTACGERWQIAAAWVVKSLDKIFNVGKKKKEHLPIARAFLIQIIRWLLALLLKRRCFLSDLCKEGLEYTYRFSVYLQLC